MRIGFIGLGKLGLPAAEAMSVHYNVVGYDTRPVESQAIDVAADAKDAVLGSDIVFIAVPTPHDPLYDGSAPSSHLENKDFDYSHVASVLESINRWLTKDQIVVLISTVLPGTTRKHLHKLVTNATLLYNPYLIAMGTVAHDMVNPEMIMIGSESGRANAAVNKLIRFYEPLMQNDPRMIVGTWEEMECTKIFYNTFISAKLSLVNMIQDVAERIGHTNVDIVAAALADSTQRITGPAYMRPGMGDGGPCHPRDNIALRWLAAELDLGYDLFDSIMRAREVQAQNLAKHLVGHYLPVIIWGESFKPGVPYTDGSYSKLVGHYCTELGAEPTYDIVHSHPATYLLAHDVDHTERLATIAEGSVVVDPWRRTMHINGVKLIPWGNTRDRVI